MNRRRTKLRTLTGSRIYLRRGKYQYFSPEPMINPKTGKVTKWHILCLESEGEFKAREELNSLLGHINSPKGCGDFCVWFDKWRIEIVKKREEQAPQEPARKAIWAQGTKDLQTYLAVVERAFADYDIDQVEPSDVAIFVDQWEGRRSAQAYKGFLSKFYAWACRRGIVNKNPARDVTVEKPKKRDVYFDDKQYISVKAELLSPTIRKEPEHNNVMVACLMDLYYLFYQRGTDVRLLRSNQVDGNDIKFTPTKTEKSSGATVRVPITPEIREVLERIKAISKMRSVYLIHDEYGQVLESRRAGDIFKRACKRAGVSGVTLKDIRAKAATDAKNAGYSEEQIKVGLAHTTTSTTRDYIRSREVPVSEVILKLPK